MPAALLQSVGALFYFVVFADTTYAQPIYLATKLSIIGLLIGWCLLRAPLPSLGNASWRSASHGLLHGAVLAAILIVCFFALRETLVTYAPTIVTKIGDFPVLGNHFILAAATFSLLHALFEEIYWRWFVGRGLELALSPTVAMLVGSLAFTAHHVIILSQFFPWSLTILASGGVCGAGMLWTLLYRKTGSLLAPWISHVLVDATIFAVAYTLMV